MARFAITVLDKAQRGLEDVWIATLWGLRELGHDVEVVYGPTFSPDRRAIVFGRTFAGHKYPKDAILYTLEFIGSPFFPPEELEVLLEHTVWDVELDNLPRLNVPAIHVPMGWVPQLETVKQDVKRDIDVVMFGSQHERRIETIRQCSKRGLKCVFAQSVYGADKDRLMARAKLVLNVHYYENNFEGPRILQAFANKRAVISEPTDHPMSRDWAPYPGLIWATLDGIPTIASSFCDNDIWRAESEVAVYEFMRARPAAKFLEEALDKTPCSAS